MFHFTHSPEELTIIIQAIEHKIKSMQTQLQKMVATANEQHQATQTPSVAQPTETTGITPTN